MKTKLQLPFIAVALLFITHSLSAQSVPIKNPVGPGTLVRVDTNLLILQLPPIQTNQLSLKWAYTNQVQVLDAAADGLGGYAQCGYQTDGSEFPGRVVWIAANGKVLLIHDFESYGGGEIVRLTPTELAIQFYPRRATVDAPFNLLRRFKRNGNSITMVDKMLGTFETLPRVEDNFTDRFGFFTFENGAVRRYSN